ncbi:AAA family ATPase [Devriesea agamarum]|uniref:AAA family ATPase n=1 Tax=Devriesea agamarum TaxID=472569 RepID=UPI00071C9978|nr:AAA family ATPase [Devriesea agamarum]
MDSPEFLNANLGSADTIDAEKAIIGACLFDSSAIRWASEHICADDFLATRLGNIWDLLHTRWKNGEPTDVVSMEAVVRREVKGFNSAELFDLTNAAPIGGSVGFWAEQVAEGAKRRRLVQMAVRAQQNALEADLADAIAIAKSDLENIGSPHSRALQARMLSDILQETDAYDWVIPGILERRDRLVLTGGEGAGKSTLVRQMAVCSAAGINPFTFERIQPVRILVVDAENSEKQWRRATRTLVANTSQEQGMDVGKLVPLACVPRLNITSERDLSALHDLMDEHNPDVLFIGPLYRLTPRAIQSDDDAAPLLAALDSLRSKGAALVMEAHAGHAQSSGGIRELRPRGSSALLGWPEFGIGLQLDPSYPPYEANKHYRKVDLKRWRGDRDERAFPDSLYAGNYYPWTPENYRYSPSSPPEPTEPYPDHY